MDSLVLASQQYLNRTYRDRFGYVSAPEDGRTGWATMYSLTRALQIELGISSPADGFGAATMAAFQAKIGKIHSGTENAKIVNLLQCALWCKGYNGGALGSGWTTIIGASVALVRSSMGLTSTPAEVTTKIVKSLFSMDAYVLLAGGSEAVRAGQQWLNGRYSGRREFFIVPTDGLFTRQMQHGIMLSIQFELGMTDDQATGNFGPGTSAGLGTYGVVQEGSVDGAKNFVRLFQLTLSCNGYSVTPTGVFTAETTSLVHQFQAFMELAETGKGDFGTWAALLVSTGDPNRAATGMDTVSTITSTFAAQMRAAGYNVVGRYLTVAGKSIQPGELDTIFASGFSFIPIFQNYNNAASYFTREIGKDHGKQAARRARQLGIRENVIIFFAVDYDATGEEAAGIVLDYFDGIQDGLASSSSVKYEIGVYATRNVANIVFDAGRAVGVWVSGMSTGFSGNLGFKMPKEWMYNQIQELHDINIDRNVVSARARPALRSDVAPTPLPGDSYDPFFWTVVEKQVLAEEVAGRSGDLPVSYATRLLLFWLQRVSYDDVFWQAYTPFTENISGVPIDSPTYLNYMLARSAYFQEAGPRQTIVDQYVAGEGIKHMAATAHSVLQWGDSAGQAALEMSDLGGWGLDFVQLWNAYAMTGRSQSVSAWVGENLGGPEVHGFGAADVIADADGWLLGSIMRSNVTFSEAVRQMLIKYPTWELRLRAFLQGRFGASPRTMLIDCIKSVFHQSGWPWPDWPRDKFMQTGAADPTAAELDDFAVTSANKLLDMAGIS